MNKNSNKNFIKVLKQIAPYIDLFKTKRFIIVLPNMNNLNEVHFNSIVEDVILLQKLGMKIIVIINTDEIIPLHSVINLQEFEKIKNQIDGVKKKLSEISRSLDYKVSFVSTDSRKFGIFNGKDTQKLGQLKDINLEDLRQKEGSSKIICVSPINKNKNEEELLIHPFNLAVDLSSMVKAEKIIFFVNHLEATPCSYNLREIESRADLLFSKHNLDNALKGFFENSDLSNLKRTHFIEPHSNNLLTEIFSVNGVGVLINTDNYDQIRKANLQDCFFIQKLIEKNIKAQAMISRNLDDLKEAIEDFYVYDRDGFIVGSGALKIISKDKKVAEIYAFAIHKDYQGQGRAKMLLNFLEQAAKEKAIEKILVKTTRIEYWFIDKGFKPVSLSQLPSDIQFNYNQNRNSKILIKTLF